MKMALCKIEKNDVIKLIEQYFIETGLVKSLKVLQDESGVGLDIVESIDTFVSDIEHGHWDRVLKSIKFKLPDIQLIDLYEQIVIESIELGERKAAQYMIHNLEPIAMLKSNYPERFAHLQKLLEPGNQLKPYKDGVTKEKRRLTIAKDLKKGVHFAHPQRLLTLLGDALRWQRHENLLPNDPTIDIFTNKPRVIQSEVENHPNVMQKHIVKPIKDVDNHGLITVKSVEFSPDGHYLAVGYSDGMVEIRSAANGKFANHLVYQRDYKLIMTPSKTAAIYLAFDDEFEDLLAVGDQGGNVSIWKISTGELYQRFDSLHHGKPVTCILFSRVSPSILTAGQDENVWFHRIVDKSLIHRYQCREKHTVNSLAWSRNEHHMITCGDHYFVVWDTMLCIQLRIIKREPKLLSVYLFPNIKEDLFIVCQSKCIEVINLSGTIKAVIGDNQELDASKNEEHEPPDDEKQVVEAIKPLFYAACISPKANWIYMVDSKYIYCFNYRAKKLKKKLLAVDDSQKFMLVGIKHHPRCNSIVTLENCGNLKMWRP